MSRISLALLTVLLGGHCTLAALSNSFTVSNYDLTLTFGATIDTTQTVPATVAITVGNTADQTQLVLYWGSSLVGFSGQKPTAADIKVGGTAITIAPSVDAASETITITGTFPTAASTIITIQFRVTINSDMRGLFTRTFSNNDLTTGTIIGTNLWPTYARHLFPCFDELAFATATVKLTVVRPSTWSATVASLPAPTSTPDTTTGTTSDVFTGTEPIPTYALSIFLKNDQTTATPTNPTSTKLTFYPVKGSALVTTTKNLNFLADYYSQVEDLVGTTLGLTTLAIVSVPNLAAPIAGYGVIYISDEQYATSYYSPQSEGRFRSLVVPVLYEFIRQFTEFRIRPTVWADDWLSTAMATYLEYILLNSLDTPFDFSTDMDVVARQTALSLDIGNSKALYEATLNIDSTSALLVSLTDPLKRLKGGFFMYMFDQTFPAGIVLAAIKTTLSLTASDTNKNRQFVSTDFKTALRTAIGIKGYTISGSWDVALTSLDVWATSSGYTVVGLTTNPITNQANVGLSLSKFCETPSSSCSSSSPPQYSVPVTVGTKSDPTFFDPRQAIWVTPTSSGQASVTMASGDWLTANALSTGYYRANYASDDWDRIIAAVTSADDQIVGRTQLVDDAFALAFASFTPNFTIPLKLSVANLKERLYRNWYPVYRGYSQIKNRLWDQPVADLTAFQTFESNLLKNINYLIENGFLDTYERAKITSLFFRPFCDVNVGTYRTNATTNTPLLLQGFLPTTVPSSSYEDLVCCGAAYGTLTARSLWTTVSSTGSTYNSRHYSAVALGCLSNYTEIRPIIAVAIQTADQTTSPHLLTTMTYVARQHPVEFVEDLLTFTTALQTKLGAPALAGLITTAGSRLNSEAQAFGLTGVGSADVDGVVKAAASAVQQGVTTRAAWLTNNKAALVTSLTTNTPSINTISGANSTVLSLLVLVLSLVTLATAV